MKINVRIINIMFDYDLNLDEISVLDKYWVGQTLCVSVDSYDEDEITAAVVEGVTDDSGFCVKRLSWEEVFDR